MKIKSVTRTKTFFIICLLLAFPGEIFAQKLTLQGDTVYVNEKARVTIEFPAQIYEDPHLIDPAAPYKIIKKLNFVFITATSKDTKPVNAIISEGKRDHSIVLCYKANLKVDVEDFYDLGTPKKLEDFIKQSKERKNRQAVASNTSAAATGATSQNTVSNTPKEEDKSRINALLKDGDAAFKSDDLDKAEGLFTQAVKIDNGNGYAKKAIGDIAEKRAQKKRSLINEYKSNGKKAYDEQNYSEAINQYKKVLDLDQRDLFASGQITDIQKKMDETERNKKQNEERQVQIEKQNKIKDYKSSAEKALAEKRFDDAIKAYQGALALNDKDEFSTNKIKEIEKIKGKEKETADFNSLVNDGDKAAANNEFELAKTLYASAKKIKPADTELDKKIATVNTKIIAKDNEDKYQTAITAGDEAKKAGEYERAKTEYTKAVNLFKDRPYPSAQLTEINESLNRQNSLKKANADYVAAIEKAEAALLKKDIVNARNFFKIASGLKAEEAYPKMKLSEIDSLENAVKLDKDYAVALQKGKAAFDKKDYVTAKEAYSKAHEFKPLETEPTFEIDLIDRKINEKDINGQYDSAMARGNVAAGEKNYSLALENYREALKLKPLEALALSQVQFARNMIILDSTQQAETQRRAIARVKEELRKKRFNEGMEYYVAYDRAAQIADMEKEVYYLKKFLDVFPDETEFNDYQYSKKIADAKKKIEDIRSYWSRTKKGYQPEIDSIPYLMQDLEKKYPDINYGSIRAEQIMVALDTQKVEDAIKVTRELIAEKPRLTFSDSINNIKASCEGIKFIGEKAYYKVRIQNNDTTDFLTGVMSVNHVKKDGSITKNYPDYVSSFPIILPGKEFFIVYSAKNIEVGDNESLSFEINDRLKKVKLGIPIPGKIYNEEKKLRPL